jgi:hypothetical protein
MARGNEGWDFVKVGKVYQYQEERCVAMVEVVEDNSDDGYYNFKVKILASDLFFKPGGSFDVSHSKTIKGYYSGMPQLYEEIKYFPLPLGKPWPRSLPGFEKVGLEGVNEPK